MPRWDKSYNPKQMEKSSMTSFNEVGSVSESAKPKKCLCKCRIIIAVALVVLIAVVVCWHIHRPVVPRPGMDCTVMLKSDISSGGTYLTSMSQSGTLVAINREVVILRKYITVQGSKPQYIWIPRDNVLFMDYHR